MDRFSTCTSVRTPMPSSRKQHRLSKPQHLHPAPCKNPSIPLLHTLVMQPAPRPRRFEPRQRPRCLPLPRHVHHPFPLDPLTHRWYHTPPGRHNNRHAAVVVVPPPPPPPLWQCRRPLQQRPPTRSAPSCLLRPRPRGDLRWGKPACSSCGGWIPVYLVDRSASMTWRCTHTRTRPLRQRLHTVWHTRCAHCQGEVEVAVAVARVLRPRFRSGKQALSSATCGTEHLCLCRRWCGYPQVPQRWHPRGR